MVACFAFCHGDNGKGWSISVLSATADSPRQAGICLLPDRKQQFKKTANQASKASIDLEIVAGHPHMDVYR
jgi:hypothetical protein